MESSEFLDILGNQNRRRILELLSYKPCYVTEISEYIGVSPKAVIDHLEMLENAGLIRSRVDDRRRKYFYIARNLRLEVSVSPYSFGVKSAYPRPNFRANFEHIKINYSTEEVDGDITDLAERLERLEKIENELSIAQRQIQSQITEIMRGIEEEIESRTENELQAEALTTLIDTPQSLKRMSREMGVSEEIVRQNLEDMEKQDLIERDREKWRVSE